MKWLRYWWPAILWLVAIWLFSTAGMSAPHTSRYIVPLLRWLLPHAEPATIALLHTGIRKSSHVVEYFILSLLLLRGVRREQPGWRGAWGWTAFALAGAWAAVDEMHQVFVPGRGASPFDVLIDCGGAALGQLCAWLWTRRSKAKKKLARNSGTG